jgi:hypothetical protein
VGGWGVLVIGYAIVNYLYWRWRGHLRMTFYIEVWGRIHLISKSDVLILFLAFVGGGGGIMISILIELSVAI